jgi:hypothetical protein
MLRFYFEKMKTVGLRITENLLDGFRTTALSFVLSSAQLPGNIRLGSRSTTRSSGILS